MAGVRIHSLHEGEINFELKKSDVMALKLCPHTLLPSPVMHEVRILAIDGDQIFASASLPVSVKHTVSNAARRDAVVATTASNLESVSLTQLIEVLSPTPNQRFVYREPVEVTVKLKANIGAAPDQVRCGCQSRRWVQRQRWSQLGFACSLPSSATECA